MCVCVCVCLFASTALFDRNNGYDSQLRDVMTDLHSPHLHINNINVHFFYGTSYNKETNNGKSCKTTSDTKKTKAQFVAGVWSQFHDKYMLFSFYGFILGPEVLAAFCSLSLEQFHTFNRCSVWRFHLKLSQKVWDALYNLYSSLKWLYPLTASRWSLSGSWARSGHCFLKEIRPCQNSWDAPVAFISSAMEYEIWDCHRRQLYNGSCKHNLALGGG